MKSVTINGREFLFVEVPEDAHSFDLHELTNNPSTNIVLDYWISNRRSDFARTGETYLPPGSYRILCKASEAGEEQSAQVVERIHVEEAPSPYNDMGGGWHMAFVDYKNRGEYAGWQGDAGCYRKATKSLHSLILSLGMEVGRTIILEKLK